MVDKDYEKGIQIGELIGEIRGLRSDVQGYREEQLKWNDKMDERVRVIEGWIQTTTGKVVVLTIVFSFIGSLFYIGINWLVAHIK